MKRMSSIIRATIACKYEYEFQATHRRVAAFFYLPRERKVYKLLRVAFRFDEVEPEGVDFDLS